MATGSTSEPKRLDAAPGLEDHVAESLQLVEDFHAQHQERASRLQLGIDGATSALSRPASLVLAIVIICLWAAAALNLSGGEPAHPLFGWLELTATLAALLIALLILVTQSRADQLAERRARLMLELELLADRRSAKIISLLEELRSDTPDITDRDDPESAAMTKPTDPRHVVAALDESAGRRGS